MPARKSSARTTTVDPLLDRKLVSTAEGALPVHTRIAVELAKGWDSGLITQTWSSLNGAGRPCIMYKVMFDSTGKEQEVDLSEKSARLITTHVADTPRQQRKASYAEQTKKGSEAPVVGVTNIPSPSKLPGFKVPELRRICTDLGLETKGTKKDLIEFIERAHAAAQAMLSGAPAGLQPAAAGAGESASAHQEEMESLRAMVGHLNAEVKTQRSALADATNAVAERTEAASALEASVASSDAALRASEALVAELRASLASKDGELASLRDAMEHSEERELRLAAELQELKGNVRVVCRLRPPKQHAAAKAGPPVAEASGLMSSGMHRALTMRGAPASGGAGRVFEFDRVFGAAAPNTEVYEELRPLARAVADGSRATVLAYGQTGSGKTYTMLGMQRLAVQQVLDGLERRASGGAPALTLRLAIIEVHNERMIDLLDAVRGPEFDPTPSTSWGGMPAPCARSLCPLPVPVAHADLVRSSLEPCLRRMRPRRSSSGKARTASPTPTVRIGTRCPRLIGPRRSSRKRRVVASPPTMDSTSARAARTLSLFIRWWERW